MQAGKNQTKYYSYKFCFERIKKANEAGYPLEAIALVESIIADRLLSFLIGKHQDTVRAKTPFHTLIESTFKLLKDAGSETNNIELLEEVDQWRSQRNEVIHGFCKSLPTKPTVPVEDMSAKANTAAKDGAKLARRVCAWHKKELAECKSGQAI